MSVAELIRQEGREEGAKIGQIQMLEKLLNRRVTLTAELSGKTAAELQRRHDELMAAFNAQGRQNSGD